MLRWSRWLKTTLSFEDVLLLPGYSEVLPTEVNLGLQLTPYISLALPFCSAAMDTVTEYEMAKAMISSGAIGVLHRSLSPEVTIEYISRLKAEFGEKKPIAVAIGTSTTLETISRFVHHGANIFVIDSAHGHSKNVGLKLREILSAFPELFIIAGNVVTKEGAKYLISCGAKAIKVGLGSGSICTTRLVTGVGAGQLSAIIEVSKMCRKYGVLTVADGGLNSSSEIVKALSAGADLVMLGYLLSGTEEAPGEIHRINNQSYKLYRGMGSKAAMKEGSYDRYSRDKIHPDLWVEEGVESYVKYKGAVSIILSKLKLELQTAMGYIGAKNLPELRLKSKFVKITQAVAKKSSVHTVDSVLES